MFAGVAELADAPDLGSGVSYVWVQVPLPALICGNSSVVEHRLAMARVASSNLVFRLRYSGVPQRDGCGGEKAVCVRLQAAFFLKKGGQYADFFSYD